MNEYGAALALGWALLAAIWLVALPRQRTRALDHAYPLLPLFVIAAFVLFPDGEAGKLLFLLLVSGLAIWCAVTLVWLVSLARRDASIMDIAYPWLPVLVCAAAISLEWTEAGFTSGVAVAIVLLWALRLSLHVAVRNLPLGEDARYARWRAKSGARWWWRSYFQVFLLQAVIIWFWSWPLVFALAAPAGSPSGWIYAGVAVFLAGFLLETAADWQLTRFRGDAANRGRVLQSGVWALSRHPNYLGEALVWWGFFLISLVHPWAWLTLPCPIYVTWFMNSGSATRMTDAHLHKRKPGYAEYAARTPPFFPSLWRRKPK